MANVAMDERNPPVYFGGWEALASAIGSPESSKTENRQRSASRVLTALARAGAIVSSGQARPGVRAEYALTLDPAHTYSPGGSGKNISWVEVSRDDEPTTATVPSRTTPSDVGQADHNSEPTTVSDGTYDSYGPNLRHSGAEPTTASVPPRNNIRNNEEQHQDKDYGATAPEVIDEPEITEASPPTAQTLIAEWIHNSNGQKPPNRVIGHLSKEIKNLLNEGIPYAEVREATIEWDRKGLHPATLPSVLHGLRKAPKKTTMGKMTDTMKLGALIQEQQNQQLALGN